MSKRTSPESETRPTSEPARKPASGKPAWSVPVAVAEVPEDGRRLDLVADAPTRDAVAGLAGLAALPRLEANFDLSRQGADGLRVIGNVTARVVQTCVVTLEPIESEIDEAIDLVFAPPPAAPDTEAAKVVQSMDAEAPPEALRNGAVDLGAVAIEFLILGIDPYPRKPDAVFEAPPTGDPGPHPFAALAALKKDSGPKDR